MRNFLVAIVVATCFSCGDGASLKACSEACSASGAAMSAYDGCECRCSPIKTEYAPPKPAVK